MKYTRPATGEARGMISRSGAAAAGFDADHLDLFVSDEIIEQTDGITASANARNEYIGQAPFSF